MKDFFAKVEAELTRANEKHPPMAGIIEGLKTMQCEVAEFDREVFRETIDPAAMELELIQIAAMCLKFYEAFCMAQALVPTYVVCEYCDGEGFVTILGEKCDCCECEGIGKVIDYTANEPEEVYEAPPGTLDVELVDAWESYPKGTVLLVAPFASNAFQIAEQQPGDERKLIEKKHCKPINDPWELFDK